MCRKIIACTCKEANTTRRDERFSGVQVKSTCVSPILRLYRRKFGLRGRETVSTKEIVCSVVILSFVLLLPCCVHMLPMSAHVVKVAIRHRNQSRDACSCRRDELILKGVLVMSRVILENGFIFCASLLCLFNRNGWRLPASWLCLRPFHLFFRGERT